MRSVTPAPRTELYHATEDENVGTATLASVRMMQALQGLGKTASLFMQHYEDHSVATFESDLDMWARWLRGLKSS